MEVGGQEVDVLDRVGLVRVVMQKLLLVVARPGELLRDQVVKQHPEGKGIRFEGIYALL